MATAAVPGTVTETEPDGFTTPLPQATGVLGPSGISVEGTLDPTSPTGLDPGDRDGFSFAMQADGPFRAVVDDGAGGTFLLAVAEETADGPRVLAAVLGAAPLTLSRPALSADSSYRVGVAAFADGTPLPYALDLAAEDAIPPWTGETCTAWVPEAEPNGSALDATDLGWFDRVLCASGSVAAVSPPGSGIAGDADTFRFRNVLPVPVRLAVTADPGLVDLEVQQLGFVGPQPLASASFGGATEILLPALQPGADYMVRVSARQGEDPLAYSFHLEPVAPPPRPPPTPLDLGRSLLRLGPGPGRSSFSVRASFEPGVGTGLATGDPFALRLRGWGQSFGEGLLRMDGLGRLRWRSAPGTPGLRTLLLDPFEGTLALRGGGLDLAGSVDPLDPTVSLELAVGDLRFAASEEGEFRPGRRVLRVR